MKIKNMLCGLIEIVCLVFLSCILFVFYICACVTKFRAFEKGRSAYLNGMEPPTRDDDFSVTYKAKCAGYEQARLEDLVSD